MFTLKTVYQNLQLIYSRFTTISNQFFAIYWNIFHKTEVETIILRCLMGPYLHWFNQFGWKVIAHTVWSIEGGQPQEFININQKKRGSASRDNFYGLHKKYENAKNAKNTKQMNFSLQNCKKAEIFAFCVHTTQRHWHVLAKTHLLKTEQTNVL